MYPASEGKVGFVFEQNREQSIKVRRVTDVHADFDEAEPGQPGASYFQFILDDGAEEYITRPNVDDGRLLHNLTRSAETLYFDTERRRLMLREVD